MTDDFGPALMARLDEFAGFTDEPGVLTRFYLSPAHRRAADQLMRWMAETGMTARLDAAGNVVGRYEGAEPGLPALLLGSHIDTIRNAGKYDGNYGVLAALAAVEALQRQGTRLPFAIEIIGFGDEEGVRFPVTMTGSRAMAGRLDPAVLQLQDTDGTRMADALARFGGDPAAIDLCTRRPDELLAYVELHIEQGPVLEAAGLPVGIVTAINGASRFEVTLAGQSGHAGTVPMALRRDAVAAAAEMILAIERLALETPDLVATVGRVSAQPGVVNVVAGGAGFTIDLRSPSDAVRVSATKLLTERLKAIGERRRVGVAVRQTHDAPATACAPFLVEQLDAAVRRADMPAQRLPSGAGHDAMVIAALAPVGMLFLRCRDGLSHHPDEAITPEDAGLGVRILLDFLQHFTVPPREKDFP
ncbi:MAG: allantoate amidohydrolase [Aliidongia sp.]